MARWDTLVAVVATAAHVSSLTNSEFQTAVYGSCENAGATNISNLDVRGVTEMPLLCDPNSNNRLNFNADISRWDTSTVTTMIGTFDTLAGFNADVSGWDTSSVISMKTMFKDAVHFNGNLSGWDTSAVKNMEEMFYKARGFDLPLTFDTGSVTSMARMFSNADAFNSLIAFDTGSVTTMEGMFWKAASFDQTLVFNTSAVETMAYMFREATAFNSGLIFFDTSATTNMEGMFIEATNFNSDVDFETSKVTSMNSMFARASAFNQPVRFNTSSVVRMPSMFFGASAFNSPVEFDTGNVIWMNDMFQSAAAFNKPLNFDTSKVSGMSNMFHDAATFNQPISSWQTSTVTEMDNMFDGANDFDQALHTWDTRQVKSMLNIFDGTKLSDCHKRNIYRFWAPREVLSAFANLCPPTVVGFMPPSSEELQIAVEDWLQNPAIFEERFGNVSNWNTDHITSFRRLFSCNRTGVTSENFNMPLDAWRTGAVVTMEETFAYATDFNQPLATWKTSRVTSMAGMFTHTSFNQDINGWDVTAVVDAAYMFSNTAFNRTLGGWLTDQITDMRHMFDNAVDFSADLSNWATGNVLNTAGMFRATEHFNSNVGVWSVHGVTDMGGMFSGSLAFNQDISAWALTGLPVVDLHDVFAGAMAFNQNITAWPLQLDQTTAAGMFNGLDGMSPCNKDTMYRRWPAFFGQDARTAGWKDHSCCENGRGMPDSLAQLHPPLPTSACGQCDENYMMNTNNQTCFVAEPTIECTHENADLGCPVHQRHSRHCKEHHVHVNQDYDQNDDWYGGTGISYSTHYICTPPCGPGMTIAQDFTAIELHIHASDFTCRGLSMDPLSQYQCRVYGQLQLKKSYPGFATNLYSGHGFHDRGQAHECYFGIINQNIEVGYHDVGSDLDRDAFYNATNTFGVLCVSAARCFTADPTSCPNGRVVPNVVPALDGHDPVCASCDPGHHLNTATHLCLPCSRGKFSTGGIVSKCTACPAHQYQDDFGQSSCKEWKRCGFEYYRSAESSTQGGACLQCSTGMYQDTANFNGSSCTVCDMDELSSGSASMRSQCGAESGLVFETWALAGTVVASAAVAFGVSYLADRRTNSAVGLATARYTPLF